VQLGRKRLLATEQLDRQDYPFANETIGRDGRKITAFVNIQKGCDNLCSFCIVPYTRGREVSRPADEVIAEVHRLVDAGVAEVTLLGQNVNSYGMKRGGEPAFCDLVSRIASETDIQRIRFTTSNPWDLDRGLIDLFGTEPKLTSYFHLPVQAGADSMLTRMRRRHSRAEYLELIAALRSVRPDIALSTDIIVGFPEETEEEHEATLSLLEAVRYDFIYSFNYNERPFTPASRQFSDDIPKDVKSRRLQAIQGLQKKITAEIMQGWEGQIVQVLVEGPSRRDPSWLSGRLSQNWIVNFEGGERLIGQTVAVKVERALSNSMQGVLPTRDTSGAGARLQVLS
jgi:tRNA-2-methylthio-N6-dimethylallyladenosine synthase